MRCALVLTASVVAVGVVTVALTIRELWIHDTVANVDDAVNDDLGYDPGDRSPNRSHGYVPTEDAVATGRLASAG